MKNIFILIATLFFVMPVFGQPNDLSSRFSVHKSKISVSTVSNDLIWLQIDGNKFTDKESDDGSVVQDIRTGYHNIKVYLVKKNRNSRGRINPRNMQLVYESNLYVKRQFHIDIIVNRFGKAFLDERQMNADYFANIDFERWDNDKENYNQQMNSWEFNQFLGVIRNESFDNTRLTIAKQTVNVNYFSTDQVKELVKLFPFDNSKLDIAKYSYKNTLDKNNYFKLNDAFAFSSSKEKLARYIQAYR